MPTLKSGNWFDRHLGTVVMIATLFTTQVAAYAILQSRVTVLEETSKGAVQRGETIDIVRRVANLEESSVPRSEHLLRDAELNKRLDSIQLDVKDIRDKIESMDQRQRKNGR